MAFRTRTLRAAGSRPGQVVTAKSLTETKQCRQQTAFLCHSHQDGAPARGLQNLLAENGGNVYVDWQDTEMPEAPTKDTAAEIKSKIVDQDWFLFLVTPSSDPFAVYAACGAVFSGDGPAAAERGDGRHSQAGPCVKARPSARVSMTEKPGAGNGMPGSVPATR